MRKPRGAVHGSQRKWSTAIIRCRLACFSEAWLWSRSSLATASCNGMGDSGENTIHPDHPASGDSLVLLDLCLLVGLAVYPPVAEKDLRRKRFFGHPDAHARDPSAAPVQHGDSAAETTEARTARAVAKRAESGAHQRKSKPGCALQSFVWRAGFRNEWTREGRESCRQENPGVRVPHGFGGGRCFSWCGRQLCRIGSVSRWRERRRTCFGGGRDQRSAARRQQAARGQRRI